MTHIIKLRRASWRDFYKINLDCEFDAYFLGFLQADGYISRKYVGMYLSCVDAEILEVFKTKIGGTTRQRVRDANFLKNSCGIEWRFGSVGFVLQLEKFGIFTGKKSAICKPISMPKELERHYIRGLIDGDGSLCYVSDNPQILFTTFSDNMAQYYKDWLASLGIKCNSGRNTRDNIYNLSSYTENAQHVVNELYSNCNFYLQRKMNRAQQILQWKRPESCKKRTWVIKNWSDTEDTILHTYNYDTDSVIRSKEMSYRTELSIKMRCWRLKKANEKSNLHEGGAESSPKALDGPN